MTETKQSNDGTSVSSAKMYSLMVGMVFFGTASTVARKAQDEHAVNS